MGRPAKPPPCKILKACSASGCAPRKTSHPLFSFIKGKVRAPNVPHTNRAQHAKTRFSWAPEKPCHTARMPECTRMYPNVPECTRMYPVCWSECTQGVHILSLDVPYFGPNVPPRMSVGKEHVA